MDVTSVNLSAFREPRGVMRILQLIFAIFAFATTTGFGGTVTVDVECPPSPGAPGPAPVRGVVLSYSYPFVLDDVSAKLPCPSAITNETGLINLNGNFSSDAEFFVATGVLSLIFCLAIIGAYAFMEELYKSNARLPMADFVLTVILALLWISSSAAWANGLTGVKGVTDPLEVQKTCSKYYKNCSVTSSSYSTLNISILLGFLNFFLWAANLWFLYKETPWFDNRQGGTAPA